MSLAQNPRHRLGAKTLALFVLQRSQPVFIGILSFFASGFAGWYIETHPLKQYTEIVVKIMNWLTLGSLGIALLSFAVALLIGWLEYITYHFELSDHALHIRKGIFYKTETAIPYRQIQNVNIVRDLFYQIVGLSQLVILTAGSEGDENNEGGDEPEGILPALDNDWAKELQAELLKRSNVERMMVVPK
ncbi:MAG: PH domain-containing protein [bacterium]|nr:PH domain-containing protein [bacterium]